jgi:uridine kinase
MEITRSSELYEVSKAFTHIAEQVDYEDRPKTIPALINMLVSRLGLNELCSRRLKVYDLSADYINGVVDFGGASFMVHVCEALKEAALSSIAEDIAQRPQVRVVLIAGPSSSGKTTFCKKLSYALRQQGLRPVGLSLDDYYGDRDAAPLDKNGQPDLESIYALNLPLLQEHVATLTGGGEVRVPRYDFVTGTGRLGDQRLRLADDEVLLMEGIHALNPLLLEGVPVSADCFYRIYISALTIRQQAEGGIFPTTDNRLLRRMVRDAKFRGTTAQQTLERWVSVRRGEEKWIVPFQPQADVNFNSAFQYEYSLLREHALPLLEAVGEDEPMFSEARRLIRLLHRHHLIPVRHLPPYSLLREFLGGSKYVY